MRQVTQNFLEGESPTFKKHFSGCLSAVVSSRSQMLFKIGVLKNFANFTGRQLCWSLFLIKLLIKKELQHRCFPVKFVKFLRTLLLTKHFRRLPVKYIRS